ncbi:MAG: KEOPS complex subunit Cgi121 [Nitrososphaerota archaeon]|jgi:KEOPS complex subunit Cgi121|nr:KEOPS complex subunit Cgi121 [Nitrososphaerota archaeon]
MQHYNKEYNKYIEITGYKNITFKTAETFLKTQREQTTHQTDIQIFDAQLIASSEHLHFATLNALQAFKNKTNISKNIAIETLLYAATKKQIQKAIDHIGIKPQTKTIAVVIISKTPKQIETLLKTLSEYLGTNPDETVLEITKEKETKIHHAFQITPTELKTIINNKTKTIDLVIERIALLATQL